MAEVQDYSPTAPYELSPDYTNLEGANRYERALIIFRNPKHVQKVGANKWTVKSQDNTSKYTVKQNEDGTFSCNCPDCILHKNECKHILAVKMYIDLTNQEKKKETEETIKLRNYRKSMCDEFKLFNRYLEELVNTLELPPKPINKKGRNPIPIDEVVRASITRIAHQLSSRRGMGVFESEYIGAYNSSATIKFLENPDNCALLRDLLHASAKPFVKLEESFSIDASGFNTRCFHQWVSEKYGVQKVRQFVKCNIVIGNKTNVITDAVITRSNVSDSAVFEELLNTTAGQFNIKQFLADAGYLSNDNYKAVAKINAEPLIMFKKGSSPNKKCVAWQNAFFKLTQQPEEFFMEYNKRLRVESTFGAIKAKYGETLKSKTFTAQVNELYCKLIAYNISVLVKLAHGYF